MKAAIIVFLGTNCEVETKRALEFCGFEAEYVNFDAINLDNYDAVFLSGGFSYGDYVRSGRLAKFTPVISALRKYIDKKRGVTVGICNGFQILCEAHILKGALVENDCSRFVCKNVPLELSFSGEKRNISLPVAHKEGKYICFEDVNDYKFLKYIDNPNGSMYDVAGLYDNNKRVMGLMPHPERAVFTKNFGYDGKEIFKIIREEVKRG